MLSFADGGFLGLVTGTDPTILDLLAVACFLLPPIAVGVAILRYRLFEIDRLIARTVSWAVVTGLLVGGFAAARRRPAGRPRRLHPGPDRRRRGVDARRLRALPAASASSAIGR